MLLNVCIFLRYNWNAQNVKCNFRNAAYNFYITSYRYIYVYIVILQAIQISAN